MAIDVRVSELDEIQRMRNNYRQEMNCQITHDSIHVRPGWTREFVLESTGVPMGYGSVAVAGPWRDNPALYEFYVEHEHRARTFDLFAKLLAVCGAKTIETQTNAQMLTVMLHTFTRNVRAESILFEDAFQTSYAPDGAGFRAAMSEDVEELRRQGLDDGAAWIVTMNGGIAGAGGVLYHYNRPYGDLYMKIGESFRLKGLGTYLIQEMKKVCRTNGDVPAARCNVNNLPSRGTLQKAGFIPCGNIVVGDLPV
jgi:GNAT superfamily N-acetyltransferase